MADIWPAPMAEMAVVRVGMPKVQGSDPVKSASGGGGFHSFTGRNHDLYACPSAPVCAMPPSGPAPPAPPSRVR